MSLQEGAFTPGPGPTLKKNRNSYSVPRGTSDGKYLEPAAAAGRAFGQTCAFKAAYLTDRNMSKDGLARLAGNKPQPVRTWLDDLSIDHKSNRNKFCCTPCAYGKARDLKLDNIICQGLPAPGRVCALPTAGPQELARWGEGHVSSSRHQVQEHQGPAAVCARTCTIVFF